MLSDKKVENFIKPWWEVAISKTLLALIVLGEIRVTRGRYDPILSPSLRVVERAEVLPESSETLGCDNPFN